MKKRSKTVPVLIGFILLWTGIFGIMWGITLLKRGKFDKLPLLRQMAGRFAKEAPKGKGPEEALKPEAISVRCYKLALTDFKDDLPVMGTVKGALEIVLRPEISGILESINFREGDVIEKGEIIASLNKKDAQLKIDYARSKLETAKTQALAAQKKLEIHKNLFNIGGIIKAKLEEVELEAKTAELQVKSAEVELKSAEEDFKKTDIRAARDGVLGSRDAEIGEFVTPQNKIATLYDASEVFVDLGIVENDIDKVTLGQKVSVTVDAHPGVTFNGNIDYVFPVVEGKSRTLTVRTRLKNPDILLLPGMFARALITVAEFKNVIVVPSLSLNKKDDTYKVFTVDDQNIVHERPVQVAYVTTDYSVVSQGLYEGEVIVTESPQELKDGMNVEIIEIQESIEYK